MPLRRWQVQGRLQVPVDQAHHPAQGGGETAGVGRRFERLEAVLAPLRSFKEGNKGTEIYLQLQSPP